MLYRSPSRSGRLELADEALAEDLHAHIGVALTLIDNHIQEEAKVKSTMSNDVRGSLLETDEQDWQDAEPTLADHEYVELSEEDLDPGEDDLSLIGSMGWRIRTL